MSDNIKIIIPYKFQSDVVLSNSLIFPIQTGCEISDNLFLNMLRDDVGDNISKENPKYCELTSHYWVWKHYQEIGNPDYIGFMQARRHFIFDERLKHTKYTWVPKSKIYYLGKVPKNYGYYFREEKIIESISDSPDCVTHSVMNLNFIEPDLIKNIVDHMLNLSITTKREKILEVFEIFEGVIKSEYAQYYETFKKFKNDTKFYCCNSFIMKRELFFKFCEFVFGVLKKVDEKVDSTTFNSQEKRYIGYLGEYLMSIFILYHQENNSEFKLKEVEGVFICDDYKLFYKKMNKYRIMSYLPFVKRDIYKEKYKKFKLKLGIE